MLHLRRPTGRLGAGSARTTAVGAVGAVLAGLCAGVLVTAAPAAAAAAPGEHYFLTDSTSPTPAVGTVLATGGPGDVVLVGDWDGDGKDTFAVRTGATYALSPALGAAPTARTALGLVTDQALVGDWDGDGKDTLAVRRGNVVTSVDRPGGPERSYAFGRASDVPLVGDWDGDGRDSVGLRRGATFFLTGVNGGRVTSTFAFGRAYWPVVVGDWDRDGRDTLGARRGAQYLLTARPGGPVAKTVTFGTATDAVLVGDWNGDGYDTLAARRPRVTLPGTAALRVGTQVQPGLYRSAVAAGSEACWWNAYPGLDSSAAPVAGDYVATADGERSVYAEVRRGDALFESAGCAPWVQVTPRDLPRPQALVDGRWRVGVDVAPGTWTVDVPAGSTCVWARARDFRWDEGSVLDGREEPSTAHRVSVVLASGDVAVASVGCGTWTRRA
ncbi:hypothetical protein [Vallicoccus soli]|uniref:VCBS repeat-containing protein n=1 Tax=Vallicoccus soli TaxID=2339232 RepID=A0A3A3YP44_9ACTN|nr:hypothetical protein [Vallicoccus soli]RJK93181.1 hypothetical protein D5H78_17430 [Vallicoccus soli]